MPYYDEQYERFDDNLEDSYYDENAEDGGMGMNLGPRARGVRLLRPWARRVRRAVRIPRAARMPQAVIIPPQYTGYSRPRPRPRFNARCGYKHYHPINVQILRLMCKNVFPETDFSTLPFKKIRSTLVAWVEEKFKSRGADSCRTMISEYRKMINEKRKNNIDAIVVAVFHVPEDKITKKQRKQVKDCAKELNHILTRGLGRCYRKFAQPKTTEEKLTTTEAQYNQLGLPYMKPSIHKW